MESARYPLPPREDHSTTPFWWCRVARLGERIILGSRTDLHVQIGTMTGQIHRNVIFEQYVCLFGGTMGAEFVFVDDNARPHRANIVSECLQSKDITRMY
ncbi:transposable element Tc3 transposase [Trichonephila clavipes]|nr:transposable element Tc3 transposase [Trichonephila clavipes]